MSYVKIRIKVYLLITMTIRAAFRDHPGSKVVYIAPMKALVRERVADWNKRVTRQTNKKLVELTGDVTPDMKTIEEADIIITTPEKWDGISRSWKTRGYVQKVSCVIIDEIHLLGGDRGPILEVIVSRMNYIGSQLDRKVRIIGLSTALANARDLADWLGIKEVGLFNFRHSVRPVPLEVYIDGFPGKNYCPRMATMNKPTYAAIKTHSPKQPVIVFVSSRRQTRLTAQDLIAYCGMEDNPRQWLGVPDDDMEVILNNVHDESLKMSLAFGIGLHHAGLTENDRKIVEELYLNLKIQILIATSTLAWGVNFPAHLVVVKGTEYYNYKVGRYVDYPITDVLQMMGRAGECAIMIQCVKRKMQRRLGEQIDSSVQSYRSSSVRQYWYRKNLCSRYEEKFLEKVPSRTVPCRI
jgi:replicative superfamily II helicase